MDTTICETNAVCRSDKSRALGRTAGKPSQTILSAAARDVYDGLTSSPKRLPPYLFYDALGSELYEKITELPEYYPTRTERQILARFADEMVDTASPAGRDLSVVELGAGTSSKSTVILEALIARQGTCVYMPTDVSRSALEAGALRVNELLPEVKVRPFVGLHEQAFTEIASLGGPRLVLFIGSSIGNLDDTQATTLLCGLRRHLSEDCWLLLGTDLTKSESILVPAYDDNQGVTAAFNKNVLSHINREYGAEFDLASFRHVALWNAEQSRIEMHLESTKAQVVPIPKLALRVAFRQGERVHTESSVKYDLNRIDRLLVGAGFERVNTFTDPRQWFGVHLARVVNGSSERSR